MFRNPVGGPRIVPFGQPRQSTDVLKNGHPAFRVTQRLPRLGCHSSGIASTVAWTWATTTAVRVSTPWPLVWSSTQARLTMLWWSRSATSNGYSTEYWHLAKINKATALGSTLKGGTRMGKHGATGLNIGGCHLHITVRNPHGSSSGPVATAESEPMTTSILVPTGLPWDRGWLVRVQSHQSTFR